MYVLIRTSVRWILWILLLLLAISGRSDFISRILQILGVNT